ncbi:DUF5615 family PIN-like protein [Dyadobacter sp. CY323]|uniref:DUF5615 family PIN-like protein n=1 Tax=Dyadobacter sp. CY323 TaxID=2907302 RepID=UPI001F16DDA0|nr:DUF5615 family PIN-like protein [Dyadobacter sp. CY323]MCE6992374.1 DUF5615 family PIN-like protein [Dyadobacter sp. CY323]
MKLLIDQNISHRIVPLLHSTFQALHHTKDLDLINADDYQIFMFARRNDFDAVITIDDDFVKLLNTFSIPPKIIWIRTGNCSTANLAEILIVKFEAINKFLKDQNYFLYEVFGQ